MRFKEFNTAWIHSKIGEICEIEMCKRIFSNQTNTIGGVPFYKIGTIGGKPDTWISQNLFNEYKDKYNYPKKGEILITCSGTVGKCIIFNGEDAYFQDSNIVWLANKSTVLNIFLFYIMNNIDWSYLNSTTITRIYGSDLRNLDFYYPNNKNEQQKVTEFLSLIDKRIDTQSKIIEDLECQIKAISNILISKTNGKVVALSEIAKIYQPETITQSKFNENGKFPVFGANGLIGHYNFYNHENAQICITCRGATCGNVNLSLPKSWITGNSMVINTDECTRINKMYLYYLLKNYNFKSIISGSGQPQIVREPISAIKINLPIIQDQNKIVKILNTYNELLRKEKDILELYKKQKAYLLKNMFI